MPPQSSKRMAYRNSQDSQQAKTATLACSSSHAKHRRTHCRSQKLQSDAKSSQALQSHRCEQAQHPQVREPSQPSGRGEETSVSVSISQASQAQTQQVFAPCISSGRNHPHRMHKDAHSHPYVLFL